MLGICRLSVLQFLHEIVFVPVLTKGIVMEGEGEI